MYTQNKCFTVLHKVKWFAIGFGKSKNSYPASRSQHKCKFFLRNKKIKRNKQETTEIATTTTEKYEKKDNEKCEKWKVYATEPMDFSHLL